MSAYFRQNPTEAMNGTLITALKPFAALNEDPYERFQRTEGERIGRMKLLAEGFDAEKAVEMGELTMDNIDYYEEIMLKGIEEGRIVADQAVMKARLDSARTHLEWQAAQDGMGLLNQARANIGLDSIDEGLLMDAEDMLLQNGVSLPDFRSFAIEHAPNQYELSFLADRGSIAALAADMAGPGGDVQGTQNRMLTAFESLGDPHLASVAKGDGIEAEKARTQIAESKRLLRRGGMVFRRRYKQQIENQAVADQSASHRRFQANASWMDAPA